MSSIIRILISAFTVIALANYFSGIKLTGGFTSAVIAAIVFSFCNTVVKPIILLLSLPITILTLGIFYLFINVFIVYLVSMLVPGFAVKGFLSALIFSFVLSLVNSATYSLVKDNDIS